MLFSRRCGRARTAENESRQEAAMKNPLDSIWGTIISGVILALILAAIVPY
ncbi:MAG: hypothetical protein GWN84_08165 [Gammaproteobacteria bacterium]|nr:hypothetical protein [Gammaproteobacteria bacterium]NIR82857.1 hypothetical protein [Gammaproteobacteria bacterium]NIR89966.1 hypothetical protein [Gammaproteobacteria bacterium]NIU04015.1 hypothetical protein [Gammaproteobacteria bacterium]NIV51335.1 hypothetical protein [Gammaproteobacteria bacterium]